MGAPPPARPEVLPAAPSSRLPEPRSGPVKTAEQVALWIKKAGGRADYHPAWTEKLRNYMISVYEAAKNQVNPDGTPAPFRRPPE